MALGLCVRCPKYAIIYIYQILGQLKEKYICLSYYINMTYTFFDMITYIRIYEITSVSTKWVDRDISNALFTAVFSIFYLVEPRSCNSRRTII